ncbi:MAG: tRNA 2-thiocytidine(32) synthetase TtcA [Steroidobacter sp.]
MNDIAIKPSNNFKKLQARVRGLVGRAIDDFRMIEAGDKVMVCLSGGKDSYTLLDMLLSLQQRAPVKFELIAVNLDQKQPGFPEHVLPDYLQSLGVPYHILEQDTYSVVKRVVPEGKTMCGLCSRLRRGALYTFAAANGITKIALGHHRDDIIETLFLNLFFGGKLKAMPPKLLSEDKRNVVIRPLAYVSERDIERYASARNFPIIPCKLCGSQDNAQRRIIKQMLRQWEHEYPGRSETIFSAICNVVPSHLADPQIFDFASLAPFFPALDTSFAVAEQSGDRGYRFHQNDLDADDAHADDDDDGDDDVNDPLPATGTSPAIHEVQQ